MQRGGHYRDISPLRVVFIIPYLKHKVYNPKQNLKYNFKESSIIQNLILCLPSLRGEAVLRRAEEGGEEGGGDRGGEEEADFPRLPLQRHRSSPRPEEDRAPNPEQVLLAGHHQGRGGLGTFVFNAVVQE